MEWTILLALFAASLFAWQSVLRGRQPGQPLLMVEARGAVSWGLFDLVAFLAILLVFLQPLAFLWLRFQWKIDVTRGLDQLPLDERVWVLGADSVSKLIAVGLSLAVIGLRDGSILGRVGLSRHTVRRDLKIGVVAFLMLAGPTYLLQILLTMIFPSEHPLVKAFQEQPTAWLFGILAFVAVVTAPIVEEYFFRMLFQGWLECIARGGRLVFGDVSFFHVDRVEPVGQSPIEAELVGSSHDALPSGDEELSEFPARPFASPPPSDATEDRDQVNAVPTVPFWPIVVSASVFALLHIAHGPDPIALFFLAIGIGYVYRATNRLLPCIVVHALLNGTSMLMLLVSTLAGE